MKWISIVTAAIFGACQPPLAKVDLDLSDVAPPVMQLGESATVVIVARLDDCLNCNLRGGFVALRSLQRNSDSALVPKVVVLLVSRNVLDTLLLRQSLNRERVGARIETISPHGARRIFDEKKLPAIYLIEDGLVVREWESGGLQGVVIGRSEIVDAVSEVRKSREEPEGAT